MTAAARAARAAGIDHVGLATRDLARCAGFYDAVLAPLGLVRLSTEPDAVGYGTAAATSFELHPAGDLVGGAHVAFVAAQPVAVDAFWRAALAAGARPLAAPSEYPGGRYRCYAAYVFDPEGNNVEAIAHLVAA